MRKQEFLDNKSINNRALGAGIWYTINNILTKGLAVITIPLFSRTLNQEEYGIVNNFQSWLSILTIVVSLNLFSSIVRAKVEFEEEINEFISSILTLSTIAIIIFYILILLFKDKIQRIMGMDIYLISFMFIYILFNNAFEFVQNKHKSFLQYKSFTIVSFLTAIISVILSIILVAFMKEKYFARILGLTLPIISMGMVMYIITMLKGRVYFNIKYWKFALILSVPLILHILSGNVLSQFDRIAITNIRGFEEVALYGMAYNVANLLSIVWMSFNGAWVPWFYQQMKIGDYKQIRKISKYYIIVFIVFAIILLAFSPEIMLIMAPKEYYEAIFVIPPVLLGLFFQFIYSLYVNIEFYYKKTLYIPIGTVVSALINIILNISFIPKYGYIVAAYTTLIGYICLYLFHYLLVKFMFKEKVFNTKEILSYIIFFSVLVFVYTLLYKTIIVRYLFTGFTFVILIIFYRNLIKKIMNKGFAILKKNM